MKNSLDESKQQRTFPAVAGILLGEISLLERESMAKKMNAFAETVGLEEGFDFKRFPLCLGACTRKIVLCPCKPFMNSTYFDRLVCHQPRYQLGLIDDLVAIFASTDSNILRIRAQYDFLALGSRAEINREYCVPYLAKNPSHGVFCRHWVDDKMDTECGAILIET